MTRISKIVDIAEKEGFRFLMLTDHETLEGAKALQNEVNRRGLDIEVPLAAEYATKDGDIIAAFVNEVPDTSSVTSLIDSTHKQGGLVLLPHPYVSHNLTDELKEGVDLIEVWNSRASPEKNKKAAKLVASWKCAGFAGPDAHFPGNLVNAVCWHKEASLKEAMTKGVLHVGDTKQTPGLFLHLSQLIKALKKRNVRLFVLRSILLFRYAILRLRKFILS